MKTHFMPFQAVSFVILLLGLVACIPVSGYADQSEVSETATAVPATKTAIPTPTPTPTLTSTDTPPTLPLPTRAPLDLVRSATIRIESEGVFVDPGMGSLAVAGSGSGFIINESGLAVTNNHVVTGAGLLKVWLADETGPRYAQVIGASECSDLALIDIEGEGFDHLDWYEGILTVGQDVYAAGFPFGDPEFTLTRGIISKAHANGQTSWASVDVVLEHDATINPGNSGGPLVTPGGQVVAVNYAGNSTYNQYFAIAHDEAMRIIDRLQDGQDVNSIGINGVAINDGEGLFGIWVNSVKSGSPADKTGIEPGDIITTLEGLPVAEDGTMTTYCDILRSHTPQSRLSIEIIRLSAGAIFAGQLNGKELIEKEPYPPIGTFVRVLDESGAIHIEVPEAWSDIDDSTWQSEGTIFGSGLVASESNESYWNTFTTPGIFIGVSKTLADGNSATQLLDEFKSYGAPCTYEMRQNYGDESHTGFYDFFSNCDGTGMQLYHIVMLSSDNSYLVTVTIKGISDTDNSEVLTHILETLRIKPGAIVDGSSPDGTLFTTEFDETDGWFIFTIPNDGDYTAVTQDGTLYIEVPETNMTAYAIYSNLNRDNMYISTHVETVAGPNSNNISLICRYSDAGWYEFSMYSNGFWTIWKYEENDNGYSSLAEGASFAINLQKAANEITAVCQGDNLTLIVNDTELGSVQDNQFTAGLVGVSVSTFGIPGAGAEFDWLVVTTPAQD